MFDLRYHVASLAAVFIALAVGIVIGVAIASRGGVDDATEAIRQQQLDSLNQELDQAHAGAATAAARAEAAEGALAEVYPDLVAGRLQGGTVAVVFLGPVDADTRSAVERTLNDAGAGGPARLVALQLPVDPEALRGLVASNPSLAAFRDNDDLSGLGRALGQELVLAESGVLWDAVAGELVEEQVGTASDPVTGVVVVRSWNGPVAEEITAEEAAAADAADALSRGVVQGLVEAGVPVVGVETLGTEPSSVDLYREIGASSVDDVDRVPGRLALALLLAGADPGHYGAKDSASDGAVPPIEPLALAAGAS